MVGLLPEFDLGVRTRIPPIGHDAMARRRLTGEVCGLNGGGDGRQGGGDGNGRMGLKKRGEERGVRWGH